MLRLGSVSADPAQTRKNLSAYLDGKLPSCWSEAKAIGPDAIDALVLVGIIFSHHRVIRAVSEAPRARERSRSILRGAMSNGKEYTNLARIFDQLGYANHSDDRGFQFDLSPMLSMDKLGPLVADLLGLKLIEAGWDQTGTVISESTRLGFHKVFGVDEEALASWLKGRKRSRSAHHAGARTPKDQDFFNEDGEGPTPRPFVFRPGHTRRVTSEITQSRPSHVQVTRLHNDIQNRLYDHLKKRFGDENVGTEVDTGVGTTVDLVLRINQETTFYEIKTGPSVRGNIRDALPQLLEYSHWPKESRADNLIIVSHLPITLDAKSYLDLLGRRYGLRIQYNQFDLDRGELL